MLVQLEMDAHKCVYKLLYIAIKASYSVHVHVYVHVAS